MDGILITILIVTGFLIYKMISSSRKQEGYKRWKATDGSKEEKTTKVKWEHGAWLRHALGATVSRAQYVQKYVGNGNGTIEGNTTKRFCTLPGILDEKKKRRVSYDLCS